MASKKPEVVPASTIAETNYNGSAAGKVALRRLRKAGVEIPANFFLYDVRVASGFTQGCGGMILKGAQFRQAERGRTAGLLTVKVPGTSVQVFVEA